jgi:hypothetical protein
MDTQAGNLQWQVLLVRRLDQIIEHRIIEHLPPFSLIARLAGQRVISGLPARNFRCFRSCKIRTEFGTAGHHQNECDGCREPRVSH